jgi:glycine C-acetyltransferase
MFDTVRPRLVEELREIGDRGLAKRERVIASPQGGRIRLQDGRRLLNLATNDYLGLANHPEIVAAAHEGLERWGFGIASARFISGTQRIHTELEARLSAFLGTEATVLYSSGFDANGGLFEALLGPEDVVISDALNHASIIDGIRLSKAMRARFAHDDMDGLEHCLRESESARRRLVVTDGVFSMDGRVARLREICDLCDRYDALVVVDDSHGVGVLGGQGRGTHELLDVIERVDIVTGTLGKALGGASGGYTSGRREIIDVLRQRSRPYLFSNALAPPIVTAALKAIDLLERSGELRARLRRNTAAFRARLDEHGIDVLPGSHPIVPIMIGEARAAVEVADRLLDESVYAMAFTYPVVPEGQARIRAQVSASHEVPDLIAAADAVARALVAGAAR